MKFGLQIPTASEGYSFSVPFANPVEILAFAQQAEKLGYSTIWANDRLIVPKSLLANVKGVPTFYEVLISLAFVAGVTKRARLGTGVLQLPLRDPVLLAKQVATLDVYTNGRMVLGVGVGASKEEFNSLNSHGTGSRRGDIADESLEAMALLFKGNNVTFKGLFFQFKDVTLTPRPVQNPLPIYISGRARGTFRRVAKWGTGWLIPIACSPETVRNLIGELSQLLEEEDRPKQVAKAMVAIMCLARTRKRALEKFLSSRLVERSQGRDVEEYASHTFIGTPGEVIERVGTFQEIGVSEFLISKAAVNTFSEYREQYQWFAEEVIPRFK